MYISGETIDDILFKLYPKIIKSKSFVEATKGRNREVTGVLLKLKNPRARLSRTEERQILYSGLGETLWYFSGRNDLEFIENYIPRYRERAGFSKRAKTVRSAYGARLFGSKGQVENMIKLLRCKPSTRQAVIQIFDKTDLSKTIKRLDKRKYEQRKKIVDVPCTCTMQFLCRSNRLDMIVSMRSNDAYIGLPHDIFAFTFIQEYVAKCLGMKLGEYYHFVGSLHIYESDIPKAEIYINEEGSLEKQKKNAIPTMPAMPNGDPRESMKWLLENEEKIRLGETVLEQNSGISPYWQDIALILLIKKLKGKLKKIPEKRDMRILISAKQKLSTDFYEKYIRKRENREKNLFNSFIFPEK